MAQVQDIDVLSDTWTKAFAKDPMITWPMPQATSDARQALFTAILDPYVDLGVAWTLAGGLAGAAWLPPEHAEQFSGIEARIRDRVAPLTDDDGASYAVLWDWLDAHVPDYPCWYLDILGVAPEAQGRGLGRRLIEHGLDRARRDEVPAFLETGNERNIAYYESFGFAVVHVEQAPQDGPMIWFMQAD